MATEYRVGIIGLAHMHVNHVAATFAGHPGVDLVACADTREVVPEREGGTYTRGWNLQHVVQEVGVSTVYDRYEDLLEAGDVDLVIVCSENVYHPDIVERCAGAGMHVCVEKPMAMSLDHALQMTRAVEAAGTTMLVNWPIAWSPAARHVKTLLEDGAVGRILQIKWRSGHRGPLGAGVRHAGVDSQAEGLSGPERGQTWWHQVGTGGGAMIDFCCYGAMMSRWYVGAQALTTVGMKANLDSHWGEADDNAMMLVRFPEAMGLFEGSWTTHHHGVPTGPIVYGTEGTLVMEQRDGKAAIRVERDGNTEWHQPPPLPEGQENIAAAYIHHLETREPVHPTLTVPLNLDAVAILDAGLRSTVTGHVERVPSRTWPA